MIVHVDGWGLQRKKVEIVQVAWGKRHRGLKAYVSLKLKTRRSEEHTRLFTLRVIDGAEGIIPIRNKDGEVVLHMHLLPVLNDKYCAMKESEKMKRTEVGEYDGT